MVAAALGAALFAVSDNFWLLLGGRALIGLGVAASLTAGLKALVLWFPSERIPLLNGLMIMLGALGRSDGNSACGGPAGFGGLASIVCAARDCLGRMRACHLSCCPRGASTSIGGRRTK